MAHTLSFTARRYASGDRSEWLRMRLAVWPQMDAAGQLVDMDVWLARPDTVVLVVPRERGAGAELAGRDGVGAALVRAAEDWARVQGFREFASDTEIANLTSQRAHAALGFAEAERLVVYRKAL